MPVLSVYQEEENINKNNNKSLNVWPKEKKSRVRLFGNTQ